MRYTSSEKGRDGDIFTARSAQTGCPRPLSYWGAFPGECHSAGRGSNGACHRLSQTTTPTSRTTPLPQAPTGDCPCCTQLAPPDLPAAFLGAEYLGVPPPISILHPSTHFTFGLYSMILEMPNSSCPVSPEATALQGRGTVPCFLLSAP